MRKASSTNIQDPEKLQTSSFKCFATCASRSGSSTKAAEGSRTPRPVGGLHRSQNARSVLECGCPLPLSLGLRTVAGSFNHSRQFGAWCLKIIWILDVGAWNFGLALRNE